jgi:hypothetical protein
MYGVPMNVYLDESGDLGWTFYKPYRHGGSSRYLTISVLIVPKDLSHLPKRIIKKTYQQKNISTSVELKGKDLTRDEKIKFSNRVIGLLNRNPSIKICTITVKKENVQPHIQMDSNKLYNYMVNFILLDEIKNFSTIDFIPDPRTIKVASGNSLVDYLQTKLWFEFNSATIIRHTPMESQMNNNLKFADFISNIVWSRYEDNKSNPYNILKPYITSKHLFF